MRNLFLPSTLHAGGYHELLMGEERVANGAAAAEWVKQRCAAHAAAKPPPVTPKL